MFKNKKILISALVLVVIIITGLIAFFIISTNNIDDRAEAHTPEEEATEDFSIFDEAGEINDDNSNTFETLDDEEDREVGFVYDGGEEDCPLGDINCDGEINMEDFSLIKEDLETYENTGWSDELERSDLNDDKKIDEEDLNIFQKILLENI